VVRPRYKPVTPDQRIRQLRKDFRALEKEEPGPERAARLAAFTRDAHDERQLNMAMHTAARCLEEDPEPPTLLVQAYTDEVDDPEERLRALVDLADLARYVDRPDLTRLAEDRIGEEARAWVRGADDAEQRHRLRTLTSMVSREFADAIRDELRFL
jgi:hypothetical protein